MGVIPARQGARAGVEGAAPISENDPYFKAMNLELQDKGFLLASADSVINWARTGSLHWMTFGLACCAIEMISASMAR
jgi:NADH-quinone oxidoreductase subunit B